MRAAGSECARGMTVAPRWSQSLTLVAVGCCGHFLLRYLHEPRTPACAVFFEWDGGSTTRIVNFMTILGYPEFTWVDDATRDALLPTMKTMPIWPAAGSVRMVDGVILVRLGKAPGLAHRWPAG